jgi:hypothetical protein
MLKLFPIAPRRANYKSAGAAKSDTATVRPIDSPRRPPETVIEQRLMSRLKETGTVSVSRLVNAVAADLYDDELHNGAGVLDLGLFGSRLFSADIIQELKAADGILWEIEAEGDRP